MLALSDLARGHSRRLFGISRCSHVISPPVCKNDSSSIDMRNSASLHICCNIATAHGCCHFSYGGKIIQLFPPSGLRYSQLGSEFIEGNAKISEGNGGNGLRAFCLAHFLGSCPAGRHGLSRCVCCAPCVAEISEYIFGLTVSIFFN